MGCLLDLGLIKLKKAVYMIRLWKFKTGMVPTVKQMQMFRRKVCREAISSSLN